MPSSTTYSSLFILKHYTMKMKTDILLNTSASRWPFRTTSVQLAKLMVTFTLISTSFITQKLKTEFTWDWWFWEYHFLKFLSHFHLPHDLKSGLSSANFMPHCLCSVIFRSNIKKSSHVLLYSNKSFWIYNTNKNVIIPKKIFHDTEWALHV